MMRIRRVVTVCIALLVSASLVGAQPAAKKDDKKRNKQEQAEIEQLVKLVDGVMTGQVLPSAISFSSTLTTTAKTTTSGDTTTTQVSSTYTPGSAPKYYGEIAMAIEPYFMKSQEARTFVPFVLNIQNPPKADSAMYVRVVSVNAVPDPKAKKIEYPWDDIHFIPSAQLATDPPKLQRVFMATAGTYDLYIALKERLPEKAPKNQVARMGVLKTQVVVPDFYNGELSTSSILVTDNVNALTAPPSPEEARERPFVFGQQELVPAADMDFKKSEELSIFFQVYNSGLDPGGKPNLTLEYEFHKKEGEGEKFFNKTNPQTVNASNLPPTFDPAKFPVPGGITVPLASFAEGTYRLAVKIIDKAANKTLTRDVNFTVKAS